MIRLNVISLLKINGTSIGFDIMKNFEIDFKQILVIIIYFNQQMGLISSLI